MNGGWRTSIAGMGILAIAGALPVQGASIARFSLDQSGPDSLAFIIDSVAASSSSGPFSRIRVSNGAVS